MITFHFPDANVIINSLKLKSIKILTKATNDHMYFPVQIDSEVVGFDVSTIGQILSSDIHQMKAAFDIKKKYFQDYSNDKNWGEISIIAWLITKYSDKETIFISEDREALWCAELYEIYSLNMTDFMKDALVKNSINLEDFDEFFKCPSNKKINFTSYNPSLSPNKKRPKPRKYS